MPTKNAVQKYCKLFRTYYKVSESNPLQIVNTCGKWKWQILDLLKDVLFQKRFDNISGAAQDSFRRSGPQMGAKCNCPYGYS